MMAVGHIGGVSTSLSQGVLPAPSETAMAAAALERGHESGSEASVHSV